MAEHFSHEPQRGAGPTGVIPGKGDPGYGKSPPYFQRHTQETQAMGDGKTTSIRNTADGHTHIYRTDSEADFVRQCLAECAEPVGVKVTMNDLDER